MKILFISTMHGAPWGGSEELWLATALSACKKKHTILASVINWGKKQSPKLQSLISSGAVLSFRTNPIKLQGQTLLAKVRNKLLVLFYLKGQLKQLAHFQADVIVISQGGSADLYHEPLLANWLLTSSIPFVIVTHSFNDNEYKEPRTKALMKTLYARAATAYFIAASQSNVIERLLNTTLSNKALIQNPLNLSSFKSVPFPDTKVAKWATVSSLTIKWKGQDRLINTLATDKWKNREWELAIYGEGEDEQLLKDLVQKSGLEHKVHFHGHEKDIRKIWESNLVLIISSRQDIVPLAMTEALVCARSVATLPIGGIPEWIVDGENGILAKNVEDSGLEEMMERLWNSRESYQTWGKNAHKLILQQLTKEPQLELLKKLEALY